MILLLVAVGGALGAPARYLADRAMSRRFGSAFPFGTLAVNVTGSALLGLLAGLELHGHVGGDAAAFAATGFCGGYTTFSTWSFESVRLAEEGEWVAAVANVGVSLVLGLGVAAAGFALGLAL